MRGSCRHPSSLQPRSHGWCTQTVACESFVRCGQTRTSKATSRLPHKPPSKLSFAGGASKAEPGAGGSVGRWLPASAVLTRANPAAGAAALLVAAPPHACGPAAAAAAASLKWRAQADESAAPAAGPPADGRYRRRRRRRRKESAAGPGGAARADVGGSGSSSGRTSWRCHAGPTEQCAKWRHQQPTRRRGRSR